MHGWTTSPPPKVDLGPGGSGIAQRQADNRLQAGQAQPQRQTAGGRALTGSSRGELGQLGQCERVLNGQLARPGEHGLQDFQLRQLLAWIKEGCSYIRGKIFFAGNIRS